ncbi:MULTISPECIES: penicillin acylase family protein [unclassified Microbacterium]|uniref:penicillin acylase family protein n=1 Tax=unclassified Microbacterium TaxID=2609290 RepID=UPI00214BF33D|nr:MULTISPECIES: penicillin acylase family protein [unclassified Microbacterium]MCR2783018.1 penicillin acylase family protein [Microbacterium sp. zg.B96]MDL5352210.1 penicillin acylase family protein [Microbacterium sp. zg-YB36]WIM16096.1 penicillin acylase family protein [Microbacterium sp. zg-B96]
MTTRERAMTADDPRSGDPATIGAPPRKRKRSVGRVIGLSVYGVIVGITVIALIAVSAVVWTIQRSFPQLDGTVEVAGLTGEVEVLRDALGVPTIVADTSDDLFFAQGYVHAQDRFWEMDFRRHMTAGRLSELFGESQLPTDLFLRTLGWHEIAEQEVAALDDETRGYYDAYADGVNAYLADHQGSAASFEYAVLGLQNPDYAIEEWTAVDSIAWLKAMAWDLRSNVETETDRALMAQDYTTAQIDQLFPGYPFDRNPVIVPVITAEDDLPGTTPATAATASIDWVEVDGVVEAAAAMLGGVGEGIGSNSWVVSGDLTASGMPLLANDPHLGASLPSVWHQSHLRCRAVSQACPFDVAGFGFSGVPGVIIGHNRDVAWGFTNLTTDVTDLYIERIEGDAYWRDGELVPLQTRTETVQVAGGDPVTLEIRSTVHGPIVSGLTPAFTAIADDPQIRRDTGIGAPEAEPTGSEYAVSLRWTALEAGTTAASIFALDRATDFADFRAAAALFDVPAQNLVYADREGNIGYQTPGRLPIRGAGDGSLPQPGWDSAYDWQGMIPFEELPVVYNPDEGYIVTANNAVVDETYPYLLTNDWDYGWRAARITELIQRKAAAAPLTTADMRDIQADAQFWMGKRLAAVYADVQTGDGETDAALALLQDWDAQNSAESAAAAYANVLWDELVSNMFVREREVPAPAGSHSRMFQVVDELLKNPSDPWWTNEGLEVTGQQEMLERSARDAAARLTELQGEDPTQWKWGSLHAITLTSDTFGSSGIAPIEWLFNRGPYDVAGGASVVDASGWSLGSGSFATVTVPSMRMVVDLSDLDASRWNHLTGTSGHTFHPNYTDQTETWQRGEMTPWPFSDDAVRAAATDELRLVPAS